MSSNYLHEKAVEIVGRCKRAEAELIDILQQIDHAKVFRELGCTSLFVYAVEKLGLAEGTAYNFINVARKSVTVPALKQAIANHEITVSKAKKIVPVITQENQSQWIEMAKSLPQHKLEREVARVSPKAATRDRATYVTATRMQLTMGISEELMARFKRAQDLESQRQQKPVDYEDTLRALLMLYLNQKDPVRKNHPKLAQRVSRPVIPQTLTPSRKNFVLKQHAGQCSHRDDNGKRCAETRWLHVHHRKPRAEGGTHAIENLTVLCAAHHQMQHARQAGFEFDQDQHGSPSIALSRLL